MTGCADSRRSHTSSAAHRDATNSESGTCNRIQDFELLGFSMTWLCAMTGGRKADAEVMARAAAEAMMRRLHAPLPTCITGELSQLRGQEEVHA